MSALRVVVDIVGSVGLLFIGYIFLCGIGDAWRYVKISTM